MSNIAWLRYFASIIAILVTLLLPWTVCWVPISTNQINEPSGVSDGIISNLKARIVDNDIESMLTNMPTQAIYNRQIFLLYQEEKPNLREYQIYKSPDLQLTIESDIKPFKTTTITTRTTTEQIVRALSSELSSLDSRELAFKQACQMANSSTITNEDGTTTTTSNISLTYYFFELHIWLFYLSILSCSCFIQLYFHFKLVMMIVSLCIYFMALSFNKIYECLYESMGFNLTFLKAELIIQMVFFIGFLHLIDRRVQFVFLLSYDIRL